MASQCRPGVPTEPGKTQSVKCCSWNEKRVCTVVVDFAVPASQGRVYRAICIVCGCRPSAVPGASQESDKGKGIRENWDGEHGVPVPSQRPNGTRERGA
jgi:hypothetical protein